MKRRKEIQMELEKIFLDPTNLPIQYKKICERVRARGEEKELVGSLLDELRQVGKAVKTGRGYSSPTKENMIVGTFSPNERGYGFVRMENGARDLFIPSSSTGGAFDKDKVLCKIRRAEERDRLAEGEVVEILERGINKIVGIYEKSKNFGFVIADNKKIFEDIYIPGRLSKGAVSGQKVVVKIIKFPESGNPEGEILEIIGHKDDPGVDILSIVKEYDVPIDFPNPVLVELKGIKDEVSEDEKKGRKDLRGEVIVTIDGEDTKDIDDAISIVKLSNGNFRLGVHIADVTHYVSEKSNLDKEALKRGTSIYLVDRVIPMLPHQLSNGICSLNEGVDRLALSCIMEINLDGQVENYEIACSVICVSKRLSYNIVKEVLEGETSRMEVYKDYIPMCHIMEELSKILYHRRERRGSVEFVTAECKIYLDDEGKAKEVLRYERNTATQIIEEFMLICNETIAEDFSKKGLPFVYRIHEKPDELKIDELSKFVKGLDYKPLDASHIKTEDLQRLLKEVQGSKEEAIISRMMLRSMKQARYSSINEGHFGLAARYYCHFTSPIRRYPDLQIHRIIKESIKNALDSKKMASFKKRTLETAEKSSMAERVAEEIEREVESYKKAEYMQRFIGKEFTGTISGVTSWGFYVELENTVEGLVRLSSLEDYYIYNELRHSLVGEESGHVFSLGDEVCVVVENVNVLNREIDFTMRGKA